MSTSTSKLEIEVNEESEVKTLQNEEEGPNTSRFEILLESCGQNCKVSAPLNVVTHENAEGQDYGEGAELNANCPKNPGHTHFIPIERFSKDHLSDKTLDQNDLYELIKAAADLTVKIDVTKASSERPETRTSTKPPWKGSGMMYEVWKFKDGKDVPKDITKPNLLHIIVETDFPDNGNDQLDYLPPYDTPIGQERYNDCRKNPGHKKFIPVGTLTLKQRFDKDVYELIKVLAGLTVKVNVIMTSPDRPEFWPNKKDRYPFYNFRNSSHLRSGSGMINAVWKYKDGFGDQNGCKQWNMSMHCWCKDCEGSDSPSNVWWEFDVVTAAHLVFDDIEASHTSLKLFYGKDDSPEVILDKVSVIGVNIHDDWCLLRSATCIEALGRKIEKYKSLFFRIFNKIIAKYETSNWGNFCFIVSHPHGSVKQIAIDSAMMRCHKENNKLPYTTCTSPRNSGDTEQDVGYDSPGLCFTDLDSGQSKCLNQSADG